MVFSQLYFRKQKKFSCQMGLGPTGFRGKLNKGPWALETKPEEKSPSSKSHSPRCITAMPPRIHSRPIQGLIGNEDDHTLLSNPSNARCFLSSVKIFVSREIFSRELFFEVKWGGIFSLEFVKQPSSMGRTFFQRRFLMENISRIYFLQKQIRKTIR